MHPGLASFNAAMPPRQAMVTAAVLLGLALKAVAVAVAVPPGQTLLFVAAPTRQDLISAAAHPGLVLFNAHAPPRQALFSAAVHLDLALMAEAALTRATLLWEGQPFAGAALSLCRVGGILLLRELP